MKDLNVELHSQTTQCLHGVYSWGYTTYVNLCTGDETGVGWGNMDYFAAILFIVIGVCLAGFLITTFIRIIMDELFQ